MPTETAPRKWSVACSDATAFLRGLPDGAAALTFFSPPYESQRTYGIRFKLSGQEWVDWMRAVVREACRATDGLVVVNAAGPVRSGVYSPTMEWLVADLTRLDGLVCGPAPWCWWKVCGIPGSGAVHYQRRDWEPVYAFARPDVLPLKWSDNTAFGHPPKFGAGGEFSHRDQGGRRRGVRHTKRVSKASGDSLRAQHYTPPDVANPGNVIEARVGGGHLGSRKSHQSEAPMPVSLAERFVCWYAPPGGLVVDPFCGSGTTGDAAVQHGRRFSGCDIRPDQVRIATERLTSVTPALFSGVA